MLQIITAYHTSHARFSQTAGGVTTPQNVTRQTKTSPEAESKTLLSRRKLNQRLQTGADVGALCSNGPPPRCLDHAHKAITKLKKGERK